MSEPLRILMLEDRATDAALNERLVRKAGIACTVRRVETEAAFRQQLHEFRPGLILADYNLPMWDGRSALAVTLSEAPEVPFIFVTGTVGEETAVEAMLGGAADFVLKQRAERLGAAVLRALREVANEAAIRESERRLQESEARYRGLFEAAHDGILIIDLESRMVVDANPSVCSLLGLTRHQFMGKPAGAFGFLEQVLARHANVEGAPEAMTADEVATASDRSHRDLSITSRVRLVNGRQLIQCDIHDMTERKRLAEEARSVLETAMDGYWVLDAEGRFLKVNPAYCRMIGYTIEELLAMHVVDVEAAESAEETAAHLATLLRGGSARFETRHRRKDGTLLDVEISATCRPGPDARVFAFVRDVTSRNAATGQLARQLDELRRWQAVMLGREDRIQQLKREVNDLAVRLGAPVRYPSQPAGAAADPAEQPAGATT